MGLLLGQPKNWWWLDPVNWYIISCNINKLPKYFVFTWALSFLQTGKAQNGCRKMLCLSFRPSPPLVFAFSVYSFSTSLCRRSSPLYPRFPFLRASPEFMRMGPVPANNEAEEKLESGLEEPQRCLEEPQRCSLRSELYPVIEPYTTGSLKVSDQHALYWEASGNPNGEPVIFLHGGPGGGTSSSNRRFFDPEFYHIILFDQRGAGKSTPHACLEENTTWDLVDDIEKLRKHLNIDKWQVFGGSWGSTLALAYCESHPNRVTGIVLRGVFMLRKKEIDWFYQSGTSAIFPDAWEAYRDFIPEEERDNFITAYNKRLNSSDVEMQLAAAKAWTGWEMATSYLLPNEESIKRGECDQFALAFARIENHYFIHKGFFPSDSFLLDNIHKIRHIPGIIVQGRYDVVCPMMSAWELHRAWPEAQLKIVPNAGHSANESGIGAELVAACEHLKHLLQKKTTLENSAQHVGN